MGSIDDRLAQAFHDNDVDGVILPTIDDGVLKNEFGVASYGLRVKVLKALEDLFAREQAPVG